MAVNLLCQFSHDDPTWDTTYQLIEKAINDHQQLIFSQFVIS